MGMESFLISSSLLGVLSQRLVRSLCTACTEAYAPSEQERELLDLPSDLTVKLHRPVGCAVCEHMGYQGRTGIYELVLVDDELRTMIHDQVSEDTMLKHVRLNAKSLAQDGFDKVLAGITSIEEVLRVSIDN